MSLLEFSNFGATQLAGSISNVAVTANLLSGSGALFPNPINGQYFVLEFNDAATGLEYEIVHVTGVAGDTITMVRGQEGTSARNWSAGDLVFMGPTAGQVQVFQQTLVFAGNPNGNVAGTDASAGTPPTFCWDTVDQIMWVCTLSGNAASAVWLTVGLLSRIFSNIDFYIASAGAGGSDSNPGTQALPWLTRQHAWDTLVRSYDLNGFQATIHVADGTYNDALLATGSIRGASTGGITGLQSVAFVGNTTTPANCLVSATGFCFGAQGAAFSVTGFKVQAAADITGTTGFGVFTGSGGNVQFSAMDFSTCAIAHIRCEAGGRAANDFTVPYTISGSSLSHYEAHANSYVVMKNSTVTITGSPTFSGGFANSNESGSLESQGMTYSGAANGPRYIVSLNGVITLLGTGSATYFPGSAAGITATGGQYDT